MERWRPIKGFRIHDDVIKWKLFPRNRPLVRGIHRSPVNSPHKGQWRGALMYSLICEWTNGWANNREAGDLGRHRAHYDVIVMLLAQCVVFPDDPPHKAKLWCILSCLSTRAVEQTVDMHVSRKLMKLRLCYCYVICKSVIGYITVPVCVETTGNLSGFPLQGITGVERWWSSATVRWFHRVDSPHKMSAWCFLSCLPERAV